MDPQQRVLLESGYVALHVSNFDRATLNGSSTGVALGIYSIEFMALLAGTPLLSGEDQDSQEKKTSLPSTGRRQKR